MQPREPIYQAIAEIVKTMPPEAQREVADYVEFLRQKYSKSIESGRLYGEWTSEEITRASMQSLWRGWDNPEDDVYDNL